MRLKCREESQKLSLKINIFSKNINIWHLVTVIVIINNISSVLGGTCEVVTIIDMLCVDSLKAQKYIHVDMTYDIAFIGFRCGEHTV